jgi:ATP-dependent exoDNAse (exonuclease V) alpha subunit
VNSELRSDRLPLPSDVPIFKGMKIYLTKNVRKEDDYINGMLCEVLSLEATMSSGRKEYVLWVWTRTNKRLPITIWSDPERPGLTYYPIRLGYCSTVHKVQGDEFPFIIIYLDVPNMVAVAYTALSRVSYASNYLIAGKGYLTPEHFAPATM